MTEHVEQGDVIDVQRYRAVIAEIDKTLVGVRERQEKAEVEYNLVAKRAGELELLMTGLKRQYDKLLTQKAFWVDEMAKGPPPPPDEPFGDVIIRLIKEDPTYTTAQLIERLDPAYFPEGITPNWKRKVSMRRRWALERMGLWKNDDNRGGHTAADDPASGESG
ncbi:MAG: hypothetical protein OXE02_08740 [Chloroflexi bacterium]|nr:hypothetical protein [Chloroflexota bacterium]